MTSGTVRKPRYCCPKFYELIKMETVNKSSDYHIKELQDGPFVIELWDSGIDSHTYRNIWYCPFCGKSLPVSSTVPQNTNTVTIDGRIIYGME